MTHSDQDSPPSIPSLQPETPSMNRSTEDNLNGIPQPKKRQTVPAPFRADTCLVSIEVIDKDGQQIDRFCVEMPAGSMKNYLKPATETKE